MPDQQPQDRLPAWLPIVRLLEASRGSEIILSETLPDGLVVLMSRATLVEHIQLERRRNITLEDVRKVIREPEAIYLDKRPHHAGKRIASRFRVDPFGRVKVKRLLVFFKVCRKLLFFRVGFVTTAHLSNRLPPKTEQIWESEST